MTLSVHIETGGLSVGFVQPLRAAAEATLQAEGVQQATLTIKLAGEAEIRELNRKYADLDEATDVLSFSSGEPEPDGGSTYLGDVVVCPTIAMRAAARGRHSLTDELSMLTVHGVLHLLGYDHDQPDRKRAMWEAQSRVLIRLGNPVRVE